MAKRVLVVEDDPDVVLLLRLTLEAEGYSVSEAADGEEALARLSEGGIDVVVLDAMLPVQSGWDVLLSMQDDPALLEMPVIMVTALSSEDDRRRAWESGASAFLSKPFERQTLVRTVSEVMNPVQRRFRAAQRRAGLHRAPRATVGTDVDRFSVEPRDTCDTNADDGTDVAVGSASGVGPDLEGTAVDGTGQPIPEGHIETQRPADGDGIPSDGIPSDGIPSDGIPSDGIPSDGILTDDVLTATLDLLEDAVVVVAPDRTVIGWNEAARRIFGWSADQVVGRSLVEAIGAEDRARVEDLCRRVDEGDTIRSALVDCRARDGIHLELGCNMARAGAVVPGRASLVLVGRDLTTKRWAEARFRSLLESAPDAVVVVNSEGRIQFVNTRTEELFGHRSATLLGQPLEILVPERFRHRHVDHRTAYVAHPRHRPMGRGIELYARRSDGSEFPVEISLGPVHTEDGLLVSAAIRDLTERIELERAHADAEERFRSAFEHAPFGMALISADGTWLRVNAALCAILGTEASEVVGRPLTEVVAHQDVRAWEQALAALFADPAERLQREEVWHARRGGVWVRVHAVAVSGGAPGSPYAVVLVEDVTQQRAAAARLEEASAALARQERLAALGELSAAVSHELRNPLGAITNSLFLLRHELTDGIDDPVERYLQIAERETARATAITENLLAFARNRSPVLTAVDLASVIDEVLQTLPPPPRVDVVTPDVSVVLFADRVQLAEVLTNLVANAYDALSDGGRLTIDAQDEGSHVRLTVSDTGSGVDPAVAERIFEPFVTSKARGTGLGLAIVKRIVEAHGGDTTVSATPGGGLTFTIRLPAARPRHVLIVDDDASVRSTFAALLQHAGYAVIEADDGDVALEVLSHSYVDVVILDLAMPRLDGYEVLARVDPLTPIIVVSGESTAGDRVGQLGNRPFAVMRKPVAPEELLGVLGRAVSSMLG